MATKKEWKAMAKEAWRDNLILERKLRAKQKVVETLHWTLVKDREVALNDTSIDCLVDQLYGDLETWLAWVAKKNNSSPSVHS